MSRARLTNQTLPQEIIQHIQSFLSYKTAAQTSLLSKSWNIAWSTRPILVFNNKNNCYRRPRNRFWDFVRKTVDRYLDLNLKVDKFILHVSFYIGDVYNVDYVDKLITDVVKLQPNVLDLQLFDRSYVLPAQVFAQKYLKELRLSCCTINHRVLKEERVSSLNLVSLTLSSVCVNNDMFRDIMLGFPLIEHLILIGDLNGLTTVNVSNLRNLKTFVVDAYQIILVEFEDDDRFLKLRRLVLKKVEIDAAFISKLSSRFPYLEYLVLNCWDGYQDIHQISSHSIKHLRFILGHMQELVNVATFDVPDISKFESTGYYIPRRSFSAASKEWESNLMESLGFQR